MRDNSIQGTKFQDNTRNYLDLDGYDLPIQLLSNNFTSKTRVDEASIKQEKLELQVNLFNDDIIDNFSYDNNSQSLLEERK